MTIRTYELFTKYELRKKSDSPFEHILKNLDRFFNRRYFKGFEKLLFVNWAVYLSFAFKQSDNSEVDIKIRENGPCWKTTILLFFSDIAIIAAELALKLK